MVDDELIKKRYLAVDKSDSVSRLIGQLRLHDAKAALVFDRKRFLGVADTHLLVRTKLDPARMRVGKIVKRVPTLHGEESIEETARLLFTAEVRCLPVIENGMVTGVVRSMDLIKELQKTDDATRALSEIMTLKPITVEEDDVVGTAISIMRENHISRVPIVDENGNLVNIAALTDLLMEFILFQQSKTERRGRGTLTQFGPRTIRAFRQDKTDYNRFPIKNISTSFMITAAPGDSLGRTINKMERFDISSIVVVEGKKPVGIVTTRDMLKLFLKNQITY